MPTGPGTTPTIRPKREAILDLVLARHKHSELAHASFHAKMKRWHDLYRGIVARGAQAYRNQIHIPFIFSTIQSFVAREVQTMLGSWPIVSFAGYGQTDAANARRNEMLVSAQMKDCGTFEKTYTFMLHAALYGTAVSRAGWKTLTRKQRMRQFIPGTRQEMVIDDDVVKFDGPDWEPIPLNSCFPQPGIQRIADMGWFIHEYYKDWEEIREMAAGDAPYFIPSAVRELEKFPIAPSGDNRYFTSPMTRWEALQGEPQGKPVRVKEMWGMVPSEFAIDGMQLVCIAVGNERVILKYDTFPFWHGELAKVFIKYSPMPAPEDFFGTGMAEINEKLQVVANKLASQKLDAIESTMDPMWWVSEQLGIQGPVLTRAGKMITVNGPVDDSMIRPFSPDLRGLEHAYPEIQTLYNYIQMGGGITEDVAGLTISGNRQTAREYLGKQENALTRIALSTRLAEEAWLEPLADTFRALNRQYLKLPKFLSILGPQAFVNPYTGEMVPPEPQVIELEDINPDYRARAYGASQMLGKAVRQQNYMGFLAATAQIMGTVGPIAPTIITAINWLSMLKQGAELFDFKNLDEIFVPMMQAPAQPPAGGGMMSPGGMPGQLPLEGLNVETLGGQLGGNLSEMSPTST